MKNKEIIEGNKLIAEFMGVGKEYKFKNILATDYHNSWDWLMPVVDKISSLGYTVVIEFHQNPELCNISIQDNETYEYIANDCEDFDYTIDSNIHMVWFEIVNFIKWYNENKV
jgi:hypothetical protein